MNNQDHPRFASYPSLQNRVVLITGGASGIGATMVEHFAGQGSRVAFLDIACDVGQQLVERLAPHVSYVPKFLACDLTDIGALRSGIEEIQDEIGAIQVLVNNAANDSRHSYADLTPEG